MIEFDFLSSLLPGRAIEQKPAAKVKRINLALQGGGAHGAFTWGVLEQLLADERIAIEGISGTSAGAVNAVMLADGLLAAAARKRRSGLPISGVLRQAPAVCRHCSAK